KSTATSPAPSPLALPYADSFDTDTLGQQPRYLAQQQGAFEVTGCGDGRGGRCVTQQAPVKPIEWDGDAMPYTIGGSLDWTDYTVSADAQIRQPGSVQLIARAGTQHRFTPARINEYYLQVSDTGAWSIVRNSADTSASGNSSAAAPVTLASGTVAALGTGSWHHLALTADGSRLTAAIDGVTVGSATDSTFSAGMVGLGTSGYQTDRFDNLKVTPVAP
ncbi:MAG: hypothetical protein QOF98_1372, partial [Streptomyces sp.]|nr:hypothetical protein [Streptomyces sp.]